MSSSGRADGRTGTPRDVFPMPRDSSFSCASDSGKDKRKERDAFTKRLSGSISLDGGALANKRRPAPGGVSELASYSGRSGGVSSNGWHDDVISKSKNLVESGTRCGSGSSVGGVASPSPRLDCSSADDSPKELDGYRFPKPSSPLVTQSRISPLAQSSHNSLTGKGVLAREHSRYSEWDSPFKMDMDYRDKIWGRSEILKRTGSSSYESATALNMHKDIAGRREQDGCGGSGDSTGSSSYHIRSYQEWRQGDRIASSPLPLRTHFSNNGYLKESATREQGLSDVLGSYSSSWHSPLSSPVNYTVDGGRDDGSQTSPRKRPRLGWGQGLAKYEKKMTGGAEDSLATKGRASSEEILLSHADSPHQGTGHGQEALSTKVVADSSGGACVEVDKDIPAIQMDRAEGPVIVDQTEKNEDIGSMPASEIVGLDSCKSSDTSFVSKQCQNTETSIQMQPQTVLSGEDASGRLKANILQRLEKLEFELDLTEKEFAKLEVQPEVHFSSNVSAKNESMVDAARNLAVAEVQPDVQTLGQNDGVGEVMYTTKAREPGKEVVDDQIGMSSSRIQENSLCLHSKSDSKLQSSFEAHHPLSSDSLPTVSVTSKGEEGIIQADGFNSQRSSLKGSSQSAASFSDPGEMAGVTDSKEVNVENLLKNARGQFSNIIIKHGVSIKKETSECWKDVYNDNQEQAERASQVLANLLPDDKVEPGRVSVGKFKDMLTQEKSTESKERIKQQLQDMLLQEKTFLRFREQVLALKYRALRETWKHEQAGLCQWSDRSEGFKKCDVDRRNGALTSSQRTSHRLRLSGTAKVDAASDEVQTMQKLLAEPLSGYQRPHLKMPCQILDEKERSIQRFINNNALIEDPVSFEQERKTINPWTPEEKKIFLDTFFLYNKNFQKIASFIEHKTVADCIEFYYRNQKSEEFEMVRRRQRLKNRRDYSLPSAYLATTTPPSNRRREITAISVDNLPDPANVTLYSDNGGVSRHRLSKNVNSNQIGSVVSSNFDNPPGNAGSVTGRNVTAEHSNKVKAVQSPRLLTTITEEFDSQWTDHERQLFVSALGMFGKDFKKISQHVGTKSEGQCKTFFSKTRKRLGLDQVLETFQMSIPEGSEQQVGGDTEDLNTAVALEDSKCRDMGGRQDDVNGTNVGECLPLGSDAIPGIVSANSAEEPLITEPKATEKGDDKRDIEDERSIASMSELKNDFPENSQKKALSHGIEEKTENTVDAIPPSFCEPVSGLKDEEVDYPGITSDLVAEQETDCGCLEDTKDQQNVYVDDQIPNTPHLKSGIEDGTNESASVVDAFEIPAVEEKDMQPDTLRQVKQESPDVTPILHSSSNQTSVIPINTNASVVAPTAQPKARGNISAGESKPRREATSWTQDEKEKFVEIIRKHGRDWTLLQESLPAKSMTQIKTYFQNSKAKLGFTAGEGTNSRSTANRKQKVDDSDSINTLYHLSHQKVASFSDESGLKSDQIVNGSISTMLGAPGSDGLSFTLFGKGKWQAEDPTAFSGMQKVLQQMCSNGYTQQSVPSNGLFPLFQPSPLPVLTASGFQQPQNLVLQQSLSHPTQSKPQLAGPQQTQQIASVQQSQASSALCNLQTQVVNQIKQQQKPSQVIAHCQQDYQNQGNQQLQKWILQQQAVPSFQPNILPSVLQQQQSPQPQVIIQQQNQPQHLSQSSHHAQHAIKQNLHYLQQQQSIQAFGQLAAVASQQLSNHQNVINQHQLSSQQQLMNQLQLHYDDQQKQYHLVQSNQLSQQQQHSMLGSLQEQLVLQLHHHQQNLQSEKQQQPIWTNLPIHMLDNSEVSHHQQVQTPDILSEKEKKQRQEVHNCQSVSLHKGATQVLSKDASNLLDPIEPKNIPKSQQHESGHLQDSQVNVQVLAHSQSKPVAFAENHPTRAGDVKLFGQVLLSQPTSCMNISPSPSENVYSQPAFSLPSVPASTVVVSVSEGLPDTYPDGTPCVSSGLGRIGPSFTQGLSFNLSRQSTSAGNFGGRTNLLDGRPLACLVKRADSENDMQNSQVALSRMAQRLVRDAKECDNSCPEGVSPSQKFEGCEQLKRMQDNQNAVTGLVTKRSTDQGNGLVLNGDLSASNSDLKSDIAQVSGIADLSGIMSRHKDPDLSSTIGGMLGVPVSSSQALPGTVIDWHSSRELRFVGGHSSKELHQSHQSQEFPGKKVCHAIDAGKLVITNNQSLPLAHSFAGGVENSQFTRESSFFGQQSILHGPGNVGLNMSTWNSGTSVGSGNDLHRVNLPTVSSVWAHGSMIVESQPRTTESRDAEDNKRNS